MDDTATRAVAQEFAALLRDGKWEEAAERFWDDGVASVEAMGEPREVRGREAVTAKGAAWSEIHEIRSARVGGPYVNGDTFALHLEFDLLHKPSGEERRLAEVGLYTVRGGKVVEERFLY